MTTSALHGSIRTAYAVCSESEKAWTMKIKMRTEAPETGAVFSAENPLVFRAVEKVYDIMAVYTETERVAYGKDRIEPSQICVSVKRNNKTYPDLEIFAEKKKGFRYMIDPVYDLIDRENIEKETRKMEYAGTVLDEVRKLLEEITGDNCEKYNKYSK